MYGFMAKLSIAALNICQILMRLRLPWLKFVLLISQIYSDLIWPLATTSHSSNKDLSMELLIIRTINVFHFRKSNSREGASSQASRDPKVPPSVMPNIHPRPNLHAQHHNLDTLERLVFEDFNGSPYTSKSTIVINGWESICCNFKLVRRKFEFVDPRGYINIAWLSIQVKQIYSISIGYFRA